MSDESPIPEPSEAERRLSVYELLGVMLDQIATVAWQKLGLQPDPLSGRIELDLVEAKVAIDLCAHVAGLIDGQHDEDDRREVHNLVRNLRLNYVNKAKEGS